MKRFVWLLFSASIMLRYLPASTSTFFRPSIVESEKEFLDADTVAQSIASSVQAHLPPPDLKVKRVDHYYSKWSGKWKYQVFFETIEFKRNQI